MANNAIARLNNRRKNVSKYMSHNNVTLCEGYVSFVQLPQISSVVTPLHPLRGLRKEKTSMQYHSIKNLCSF